MVRNYIVMVVVFLHIPLYSVRYAMRKKKSGLALYSERRDTKKSGEPAGKIAKKSKNIFVFGKVFETILFKIVKTFAAIFLVFLLFQIIRKGSKDNPL